MEHLVTLLRWEQAQGLNIGGEELEVDWRVILKALQYLRDHYTEQIYARDLARATGVSESRLKVLFQEALGLSWVKLPAGLPHSPHRRPPKRIRLQCDGSRAGRGFRELEPLQRDLPHSHGGYPQALRPSDSPKGLTPSRSKTRPAPLSVRAREHS